MEPGINKPFDRIAKDFDAEAPLVFLRLTGLVPPGVEAELSPLRCVVHVEFFVVYRNGILEIMARYGGSLAWQCKVPVHSVLSLLCPDGAIGPTRVTHEFRAVKMWELDPEPVLNAQDPGILPWAMLMQLSRAQAEKLGAEAGRTGNEEWIGRFLVLVACDTIGKN